MLNTNLKCCKKKEGKKGITSRYILPVIGRERETQHEKRKKTKLPRNTKNNSVNK